MSVERACDVTGCAALSQSRLVFADRFRPPSPKSNKFFHALRVNPTKELDCVCDIVAVGVAAVISVVVVVTVDVRRLQGRRVSAHGMTNGTQELESRIRPVVELGQTGLDS